MNSKILAHSALLCANLIYALNYTLAKDVMPNYIQPSGFILLRVISAIILFSVCYIVFVKEKIYSKDLALFFLCGIFGVTINQLLFFQGLNLTTPINAAIIMTTNPILVIVISLIYLKEQITIKKTIGVFLGILGATILILNNGSLDFNNNYMKGNLFIFLNATSYALYLVLVKPLIKKYNAVTVMMMVFLFGSIFVIPFGFKELISVEWMVMPKTIVLEVLFVLIFTTFLAYLLNSSALKKLNPTTVSTYIYLQPILASIFAILLHSDQIDATKIVSITLVFFGIYLVSVDKQNIL